MFINILLIYNNIILNNNVKILTLNLKPNPKTPTSPNIPPLPIANLHPDLNNRLITTFQLKKNLKFSHTYPSTPIA